jgi:H+-transporting ATPase
VPGDGGAVDRVSAPDQSAAATPDRVGLSEDEARRRLAATGPNAVVEEAPAPLRRLLAKFWAPIPWLLEAAMVLQLALGEPVEAAVIGALLLFNAALGFVQEGRAGAALAALKKRLAPTALVCRDGAWQRRPAADLVPGDLIRLALGALVPADARLVAGSVLVDQSTLTGESVPVEAAPGATV